LLAASFYDGSLGAALVLVQVKVDAEHATRDSGSTAALMAAQEGHTDSLQVLVQSEADFDKATTNACFGGGLERAHGFDAGGGARSLQSRTGTSRAS
jgi:hypothetical protein